MNSSTEHLWSNAEIVALLVNNRHEVRSYGDYVEQCKNRSIRPHNESFYNEFMSNTGRPLIIKESLFA